MSQTATMIDQHLRIREVADLLGVQHWTVRRWIADGSLTAIRLSRSTVRISETDLRDFLATAATSDYDVDRALEALRPYAERRLCPACGRRDIAPGRQLCLTCQTRHDDRERQAAEELAAQRHERRKASKRRWWAAHGHEAKQRQRDKRQAAN